MTKQEFIDKRNQLFTDEFLIKIKNKDDIVEFCSLITKITGVQCCNINGYINELLPKLYVSSLKYFK